MWWIVLLAAVLGLSNGFLWSVFFYGAIVAPAPVEVKRPYGRMIDLPRNEWRRL